MKQKEKKLKNKEPLEKAFLDEDSLEKELLDISLFVKIGIVVLSLLLVVGISIKLLPQAITVSSSGRKRDLPIYSVETDEKKVALSFDAAWGNEDTKTLLDILAKHNIKVTFFMTGEWMRKYPDDVKAIAAAGHDLGNHGENHKHMSQLSKELCTEEIMKAHNRVKELTGIEMNLFRPPYGDYNNTVVGTARDCGYYTIQWDVDSLDWKDYGVDSIVKKCTEHKNLGNGSIILMHNGAKYTPAALDRVITGLKDQGYELVPISQLIYTGEFTIDHTGRQHKK
ncbi:MAG: polysaccharide deacetylase family protein [Clostridiales bacterium]|nr:polysaccharide deacetylase family protein [Clostridiales bacterium]